MIKDSGERQEFNTGAVRDISEEKGRCDLLPLQVVANFYAEPESCIFRRIDGFMWTGNVKMLEEAISKFTDLTWIRKETLLLEVSKHFEAGCKKYGKRNWEKGIPLHCYMDSAIRHYLKWLRKDSDEPHDRAFVWNLLCAMWTLENKPDMNDLPCAKKEENEDESN